MYILMIIAPYIEHIYPPPPDNEKYPRFGLFFLNSGEFCSIY